MKRFIICLAFFLTLLQSCSRVENETTDTGNHQDNDNDYSDITTGSASAHDALPNLITVITIKHNQTKESLLQLQTSINQFLGSPEETTLLTAKQAWLDAHKAWRDITIIDFGTPSPYDGLLFGNQSEDILQLETLLFGIDTYPVQEGFLDAIEGYEDSGIVMDDRIEISENSLRQQHGITSEEEICLGFHPLEYYLWSRPITDFNVNGGQFNQRRRNFVLEITQLLVQDVNRFIDLSGLLLANSLQQFSSEEKNTLVIYTLNKLLEDLVLRLKPVSEEELHSAYSGEDNQETAFLINTLNILINEPVSSIDLLNYNNSEKAHLFIESFNKLKEDIDLAENKDSRLIEHTELVLLLKSLISEFQKSGYQ